MKIIGTLVPAYGRDYKSKKEVIAALNEGKDFLVQGPFGDGYTTSIRDMDDQEVNVRFKKQANVCVVKVTKGVAS